MATGTGVKTVRRPAGYSRLRGETPLWRDLTILAQDPDARLRGDVIWSSVRLPVEALLPGPCGARIKVVDYDASLDRFYPPLPGGYASNGTPTDPMLAMTPRQRLSSVHFHQQNAYAIAMRILARFETALGRRVNYAFAGHQLHIAPHAFSEANAYYSRESRSLCFGYFPNNGGGTTFTCLSHDIVAHEMAHALLDGLRPRYIDPSSPDQAAFHEGFADVIALLVLLSDPRIVETALLAGKAVAATQRYVAIKSVEEKALKRSALLGLAESMGEPLPNGSTEALRRSVELKPRRNWSGSREYAEPHQRGEVLVHCLLSAFIKVWRQRISALGQVKPGFLDLKRVVEEGATSASHLLTMSIRAIDYTPPTDVSFSDYLTAILTADREMLPDDGRYGYRQVIRDSFAAWNIRPAPTADAEGCWRAFDQRLNYAHIRFESLQRNADEAFRFIWNNAQALKLSPNAYCEVTGVRPIARTAPDGLIVRETVVDYVQMLSVRSDELAALGLSKPPEMPEFREVRLYGGGVLIFDEYGTLKFSIGNDVCDMPRQQARLDHLGSVGFFEYRSETEFSRGFFSRLHLNRACGR